MKNRPHTPTNSPGATGLDRFCQPCPSDKLSARTDMPIFHCTKGAVLNTSHTIEENNSGARVVAADLNVSRPFEWALGESINALAPRVKEHVLQSPGTVVVYRGRMRVWRDGGWRGTIAGWLMRIGVFANFLFPETGDEVDFELKHVVTRHEDCSLSMSWIRTFQFSGVKRKFHAMMCFHPQNGPIINWHGCWGLLEVELCPRVEGDAIVVVSRREWLTLGLLRIRLPKWLMGRPLVREWQEPNGALHIRVEIHNSLLGHFFGYDGIYSKV